ncbi:MAG: transporter substrate-binding domain-containing protein [Campylobacter sp.]|nr:transporter substrate-binding domain-containing protein [Campylobacter sp.]
MNKLVVIVLLSIFAVSGFANSLSEIRAKNEIRVGVRTNYPPFSKTDGSSFEGFEVELSKAIASKILGDGASVVLVGVEAKDRIPFLNDNKIDIAVANFSVTPEREKLVDVSVPYFSTYMAVVSHINKRATKLSDFNGGKMLVIPGTTSQEYINENKNEFASIKSVDCLGLMDCFNRLKNGEADGYFHTVFALGAVPILDRNYEVSLKSVGKPSFIAVAIKKGNKELVNAVNDAIFELSKEGFFKAAYEDTLNVYYKGNLDKKYFLLDDIYNFFMEN